MSISKYRQVILRALTKAVDECVREEVQQRASGPAKLGKPVRFKADITVKYDNDVEIRCVPEMLLDFDTTEEKAPEAAW